MSAPESTPSSEASNLNRFNFLFPFLLLLLVVIVFYGFIPCFTGYEQSSRTIAYWIYRAWVQPESDWGHGMFILPICAYLVYSKRKEISQTPVQSDNSGLVFLFLAFLFFWIGMRADLPYPGFISVHFLLAGFIIWFYGWPLFRLLIFPWTFLVFMWPLPFLDSMVAFPLRLIMSKLSFHLFNLLGIHSVQIGTAIVSAPDYQNHLQAGARFAIDVADPCSGLRSLFALLMVSALYAYFALPKIWQKWALFLCAPFLAILGNMIRILILTLGTLAWGSKIALGTLDKPSFFHEFAGFLVFAVALGGMIGISTLLEGRWLQRSTKTAPVSESIPS